MAALAGKIAVITGAASGVGRATALRFSREGAKVFGTDIVPEGLTTLEAEIAAAGGEARVMTMDVSNQDQIAECFAEVAKVWGGLDVLINNAGMSSSAGLDPGVDHWTRGVEVTLSSAYWMSKGAIAQMQERGRGAIVNISSLAGNTMGMPVPWYASAKAGMSGLTRSLATTYGPAGIRVNGICLGSIDTPRLRNILNKIPEAEKVHDDRSPLRRVGKPEEIAACALFLASEEASYVNGHMLIADGGFSIAM
jgi:3-oxoacyl-[acyl-carrier protein] reductase